jgi:hypothetical protein
MRHHETQTRGHSEILSGYHLRVGQVTRGTRVPAGYALEEQRLDETEVGDGTTATLIDTTRPPDWVSGTGADAVAQWLGLVPDASGLVVWDVFDAVLTPGDIILLLSWRRQEDADHFANTVSLLDQQH